MGTSVDNTMPYVPDPVEQTAAYDEFMDETRAEEDLAWQERMDEVLQQEEEFKALEEEVISQEELELQQEEEQISDTEQQAQQEAGVIQDPTAPGQDPDDFLYGFYGLIDDEEYYSDLDGDEDDYY